MLRPVLCHKKFVNSLLRRRRPKQKFVVPSATSFVPPFECLLRFTTNVPLILKSVIKH